MIFRGAGPKDAVVLFDLLPCHAVVIGVTATRCNTQLFKDFTRRVETKIFLTTHAPRDFLYDPPVRAGLTGRIVGLVDLYDSSLAVTRNAFVFTPGGAG